MELARSSSNSAEGAPPGTTGCRQRSAPGVRGLQHIASSRCEMDTSIQHARRCGTARAPRVSATGWTRGYGNGSGSSSGMHAASKHSMYELFVRHRLRGVRLGIGSAACSLGRGGGAKGAIKNPTTCAPSRNHFDGLSSALTQPGPPIAARAGESSRGRSGAPTQYIYSSEKLGRGAWGRSEQAQALKRCASPLLLLVFLASDPARAAAHAHFHADGQCLASELFVLNPQTQQTRAPPTADCLVTRSRATHNHNSHAQAALDQHALAQPSQPHNAGQFSRL
eukprot:scaffold2182_cov118-Isochrysis_galbana.AAC.12